MKTSTTPVHRGIATAAALLSAAFLLSNPVQAQPLPLVFTNDTGISSSEIWVQFMGGNQVDGYYSNVLSGNQSLFANTAYSLDQLTNPTTGRAEVFINEFSAGRIYINFGAYGLQNLGADGGGYTPAAATTTDPNYGTRYQYFEQTILTQPTGGTTVWADLSYIDFTAISLSMFARYTSNNTINPNVGNSNQPTVNAQQLVNATVGSSSNASLAILPSGASQNLPNPDFARVISPQFSANGTYHDFTSYLGHLGSTTTQVWVDGTFVGTGPQPTGSTTTQAQTYNYLGNFTSSPLTIPGHGNATGGGIALVAQPNSGNSSVAWLPPSYDPGGAFPGVGNDVTIYITNADLNSQEGVYGNNVGYYISIGGGNATYYSSIQNDVYGRAVGDLLAGLSFGYVGSTVNATLYNGNATTIGALPSSQWWAGGQGQNATLSDGTNITWEMTPAEKSIWFSGAQPDNPEFYNGYAGSISDLTLAYGFPLQDRLGTNLLVYNTASPDTANTYLQVVVNPDGNSTLSTAIWSGNGSDSQWSTAANWSVNGTAAVPPVGASVQFVGNHTETYVVDTGGNRTVGGINFNYAAGNFTLANNTVTLGGNIVNSSNKTQTIDSNLTLSTNSTVTAAFGDLALNGAIALSNNSTANAMRFAGTQNTTVSGVISDGTAVGGSVSKSGNGTLTLSANNTFTGDFIHQGGTVVAGADSAMGTGELGMHGGTLIADGGNRTFANSGVLLAGTNAFLGSNAMHFTGNLVLTGDNAFFNTADVEFSGGVSGSANGTTQKSGDGTVTLSGATPISYNGTFAVNDGVLLLAKTGGASYNGSLAIGNGVGAAESAVVRLGAGNQTTSSTGVQIASDGVLDLQTFDTTLGNITMSGGLVTGSGTLNLTDNSTVIFNGAGSSTAEIEAPLSFGNGNGTFAVNANQAAVQLTVSNDIQGNGSLTKGGSGVLALTSNVSYSGTVTVAGGILATGNATSAQVLVTNGALSPGGSGAIASITLGNLTSTSGNTTGGAFLYDLASGDSSDHIAAANVSVGNSTLFLFSSSTFASGTGNFTLMTGTASLGTTPGNLQFASIDIPGLTGSFSTAGNTLVFHALAGVVSTWNGGASADWSTAANWDGASVPLTGADIVFTGSNTTVSTGANRTTGAITFDSGASAFTVSDNTITLGGTLTNNSSQTQTINSNLALNASRTIFANTGNLVLGGEIILDTSGALANTLTFSTEADRLITVSNSISNGSNTTAQGGGLVKIGDGTLALSGNNSGFTGPVTIAGGVLSANGSYALGDGTIATNTLTFDGGTLQAASDILSGPSQGINRAVILQGNGTFDTNGNTILTSGPISGAGTLLKTGDGNLVLVQGSSVNTFTGGTIIEQGSVVMENSTVLGAPTSPVTIQSGGSLTINGSFAVGSHPLTLNGAGDGGNGALRLTGTLSTQNTSAWDGSITLGSNASIQADPSQTFTLGGPSIALGNNTLTLAVGNSSTISLTAPVNGSGGLLKTGNGTLNVSSSSPSPNVGFNGTTTVQAGTLSYQGAGALGAGTSGMDVQPGGTLQLAALPTTGGVPSQTGQFGVLPTFAFSAINLSGAGMFADGQNQGAINSNVTGNVTLSGPITLDGDTLIRGTLGALTIQGDISLGSSSLTIINRSSIMNLTGAISGNGGITMNSTSLNGMLLSGNNTYAGQTSIEGDSFIIAGSNNALGSTAGSTTVATTGALWLQGNMTNSEDVSIVGTGFQGTGALRSIGGANTFGGNLTLAGATQINSAADSLTFSQNFDADQTLTIQTESPTAQIVFEDGFIATSAVEFQGCGTVTINGSLTGGQALTINGGTLAIGNASAYGASYALGNGTLAVGNSSGTQVTVTSSTGTISPTGLGVAGNASFSSITATGGARFAMDLGANATLSDVVHSVNGPNMSGNLTFYFNDMGATTSNYTLITSVNGNGGNPPLSTSEMSFTSNNPLLSGTFSVNNGGGFYVSFNATDGAAVWGAGSGTWGNGTAWHFGETPAAGSAVSFTGNATATVDTETDRLAGSIVFAPGAGAYTLANNTITTYGNIINNSATTQTIESGIELAGDVSVIAEDGNIALSGPISFGPTTGQMLTFSGNHNTTVSSPITTETGTVGHLVKEGSGGLTLSGNSSFAGTTTIVGGSLILSGSLGSQNAVTVGVDGTLGGNGTAAGTVAVYGTLSPGNSPGDLATGSETWYDGGNYNWELHDVVGSAGTGYDTITVTGSLSLVNLTTGGFDINLWTLSSIVSDSNGDALNFDEMDPYSWTLVSTTTGVTGFEAGDFVIHTLANNGAGGFSNAFSGTFSMAVVGNDLLLNYTPIPEPATWLLIGTSIALLGLSNRRRRRG